MDGRNRRLATTIGHRFIKFMKPPQHQGSQAVEIYCTGSQRKRHNMYSLECSFGTPNRSRPSTASPF